MMSIITQLNAANQSQFELSSPFAYENIVPAPQQCPQRLPTLFALGTHLVLRGELALRGARAIGQFQPGERQRVDTL